MIKKDNKLKCFLHCDRAAMKETLSAYRRQRVALRPKGSVLTGWPASSARRSKDISSVVISIYRQLSCEKAVYNNDTSQTPNSERVPSFFAELRTTNAELRTKNVLPFSFHLEPCTLPLPCPFPLVPLTFDLVTRQIDNVPYWPVPYACHKKLSLRVKRGIFCM